MGELTERATQLINTYAQPVIVEEYIEGREINVAVIGNGNAKRTLPPSEISFVDFPEGAPKICCYEAKWVTESQFYSGTVPVCPAELEDPLRDELNAVALAAYDALGCLDYARVDMRVGPDGRVYVIEVNPNPDISSDAGFARAAKAAGLDYAGLITEIVRVAEERYAEEEEEAIDAAADTDEPDGPGGARAVEADGNSGMCEGVERRPIQGG
jgi:D-alanine-D-alanine ligase